MNTPQPVLHELAEGALLVEYPDCPDAQANRRAVALAGALLGAGIEGLLDAIPGARTLLLAFEPLRLSHEQARRQVVARSLEPVAAGSGRMFSIAAAYGGEMGPDLSPLASRAGLTPEEFARRHCSGDYTVAFLGFSPGFAYLTGLDAELQAPRLPTPRPRVAAGSLAIGGPYTGIYPSASPGGWRLIGRAAVRLFDVEAEPPVLLSPGDRVRFEPVAPDRLAALERDLAASAARPDTSPGGHPVIRIVKPGLFTSIQGAPRPGGGARGLPPGGAMDEDALAGANTRLGNASGAAALEITLLGPELEAVCDVGVCLSGAAMAVERNGVSVEASSPIRLAAGSSKFARSRILLM